MLQLTDTGAIVTLSKPVNTKVGKANNGLYWFAFALLIGAVGVAMAMSLLSERLAIGALALLVVGSYVFNHWRERTAKAGNSSEETPLIIDGGTLEVQAGQLIHHAGDTKPPFVYALSASDVIQFEPTGLHISDENGATKIRILDLDSAQEGKVIHAILTGQTLNKRHANIRMMTGA